MSYIFFLFSKCNSMKYIDLSNINKLSVTNMSHMFDGYNSLNSFNLSNFDINIVTVMSFMD